VFGNVAGFFKKKLNRNIKLSDAYSTSRGRIRDPDLHKENTETRREITVDCILKVPIELAARNY